MSKKDTPAIEKKKKIDKAEDVNTVVIEEASKNAEDQMIVRVSDIMENKSVTLTDFFVSTIKDRDLEIWFSVYPKKGLLEFKVPKKGSGFPETYTLTPTQFIKLLRSSSKKIKNDLDDLTTRNESASSK